MTLMSGIALWAMINIAQAPTVYAAEGTSIEIAEDVVKLGIGETMTISVNYAGLAGGFGDLAAVSSDSSIAAAVVADAGNGQACLAIAGTGLGTATVAVYSISNSALADYVAVQSGLAADGQIVNQTDGTTLTAIYDDRVIRYQSVLTGRNDARMAVTGLILERESGLDCLKVSGELMAKDSQTPGMTAFYANFYDTAGGLMKRQAVYARDPQANAHIELKWYIPGGCAQIVLE